MLKKECGRYARFATASLTAMRYQCRLGVLAAGDYGVAQVRARSTQNKHWMQVHVSVPPQGAGSRGLRSGTGELFCGNHEIWSLHGVVLVCAASGCWQQGTMEWHR